MNPENALHPQIQAEIEHLRTQFPETKDLYREVCVLLFFRFGITPTANKLYQFVRKGSMSAPAEALGRFWEVLREKSRVRIEHPDLPDELRTSAGELTAILWTRAQALALENLAAIRSEAQAAALEAKSAQNATERERDQMQAQAAATQEFLRQATEQVHALEQRLTAETVKREGTERLLQESGGEIRRLQVGLEEARREFASELEKQRAAGQLAEERFSAAEARALLEIDRERVLAAELQKELGRERTAASQAMERYRSELAMLQGELGQLRQQTGVLEGNLQAVCAARDRISGELEALRTQLASANADASALRVETESRRLQAEEAQKKLADCQAKLARRPIKTSTTKPKAKRL